MEHSLRQLRDNWILIAFLGGIIVSWTMLSSRLANAEQKILDLQSTISALTQIQIDLAVIKQQITDINKKLP